MISTAQHAGLRRPQGLPGLLRPPCSHGWAASSLRAPAAATTTAAAPAAVPPPGPSAPLLLSGPSAWSSLHCLACLCPHGIQATSTAKVHRQPRCTASRNSRWCFIATSARCLAAVPCLAAALPLFLILILPLPSSTLLPPCCCGGRCCRGRRWSSSARAAPQPLVPPAPPAHVASMLHV